jgi:hypothetical protein
MQHYALLATGIVTFALMTFWQFRLIRKASK